MTEEQNKLAEAIEHILAEYHRAVELDDASLLPKIMSQWCDLFFKPGASAILAALREREPATDAVLAQGDKLMQAKLSGFNEGLEEAARLAEKRIVSEHDDMTELADEIRALKGKGASQGAAAWNYVADKEVEPTRITFANGRVVRSVGGYLVVES